MRAIAVTIMLAALALAGCLSASDGPDRDSDVGSDPLLEGLETWDTNWDTISGAFELTVDPPEAAESAEDNRPLMTGTGTLTLVNKRDVPMPWVNLYGGFEVTEVTDENGEALEVEAGNVTLTGDVAPATVRTISFAFEGRSGDALAPVGGDEFGAHYVNFSPYTSGSTTYSEVTYTVHSPTDWVVLGAANLTAESVEGNTLIREYFSLVPYLRGFVGQGLEVHSEMVDGILVETYYFPSQQNQGDAMHETMLKILEHVPAWTGPYPFDHVWTVPHHVSVNAFSIPGINFMGWTFYRPGAGDAPVQFGRDLIPIFGSGENSMEAVLVHETVHNWWGHVVRGNNSNANSDGEKDTWMTEGITTYLSETVWWDRLYTEADAKESADHMVRALQQRAAQRGECGVTEGCGDHYVKGAMSMRALEAYGIATDRPDLTFDLLKHAAQVHGRQYDGVGYADTRDFVATFEEAAGEDLSWWYEAWHYSGDLADFVIDGVELSSEGLLVEVTNLGTAKGAALVELSFPAGESVRGWTVVAAGATSAFVIPMSNPAMPTTGMVDALQHVYESNENNNQWALAEQPSSA